MKTSVMMRFLKGIDGWVWVVAFMGLVGHASQPSSRREMPRIVT